MTLISPEANKHIFSLINGIQVAMLTTVSPNGSLRSRPMATLPGNFDGLLWFFTKVDAAKVDEVQLEQHVNVSYSDCEEHRFVSISGRATLMQDRQKLQELWSPVLLKWFRLGLDEPQLALLRVECDHWEYWDSQVATLMPLDCSVPASLPADEILLDQKPRSGKMDDSWVTQDVGTKKNRNVIPVPPVSPEAL